MVRIPVWVTLGVAVLIAIWGIYRIRLAFRSQEQQQRAQARGGLFGMPRRTHALVGIVYLLLAAGLVATSLGYNPLSTVFVPTPTPPPPTTPAPSSK